MVYSSTNTFISRLPPPHVCSVGDIPFSEYTRRLCSNIRSKGGVCIMPTTIVRALSFIVRERYICLFQSFLANHTYTVEDSQA